MIRLFRLVIIFAILPVFSSLPAFAQADAKALTLEECIRLAQSVPSAASVAKQESEIAGFGVKQAQAALLPQSQFDTAYTYNSVLRGGSPLQSFVALNGVREYQFLLTASQEIDLSGRLRADVARARAERDVAGASAAITQRDIKRAVTAAYYRLLLARHLEQALRDSLAEAESFEKRTRLLLEQGEAAQADLVKAAGGAAFLRQAYNAAQLDAQTANHELAAFWTKDVAAALDIVDVFDPPPAPESAASLAGTFLSRPEFSLLDAQRRSFIQESRRIRANLYPQANLSFQYGLDTNVIRARDRGYALFVNLNVPIFDWMRTLNASKQFRLRAEQTDNSRALAERVFSRDFESARTRVKMLFEQIGIAAAQMKLAEEDVRLSRIRFEGGEGSALDVVTAQTQLAQARGNYYTSIANYLNARADREVAAGR
ncbi:MAG: TolC family protein [Acidobacteria bacterium]|nr:TolC family protein [Acidobacteriota bacterium]MCL5287158.1 TolC family protein [Acidobacteriota bacterium]